MHELGALTVATIQGPAEHAAGGHGQLDFMGALFVFMLATTAAAGVMNIFGNYLPRGDTQGYLNVGLTVIMLALACVITATSAASSSSS